MGTKTDLEELRSYFFSYKSDTIRNSILGLSGGLIGYFSGSPLTAISFGSVSYFLGHLMGPSLKTQKHFFGKYFDFEKFPDFKIKKPFFRKNSLAFSGCAALLSVGAQKLMGVDIIDRVNYYFSEPSLVDFMAPSFFTFATLSLGHIFGDLFAYVLKHPKEFVKNFKTSFIKDDLSALVELSKTGYADALPSIADYYFKKGDSDSALSIFFNTFYLDNLTPDKSPLSLELSRALFLEKNKSTKELLIHSLSRKLPEPFIDGLVNKLVDESIEKKDTFALTLSGFYLENKNNISSKKVWEQVGLQLEGNDNLESRLFAKGTSEVESINISGNEIDIIKSTLLRKKRPLSNSSRSLANDEKVINNFAYDKFISDESLNIPLILHNGELSDMVYSLIRLDRSNSLFDVAKNNPENFSMLIREWEIQTQKINSVYEDIFLSKEVVFNNVNYSNRIEDQLRTFGKDRFNHLLAKNLLERINLVSEDVDFLKPSIDNLPEQWLYNPKKNIFSRLDFENKGIRRSMEDRVNSTLWIYGDFPDNLFIDSLEFQINEFCKQTNVDVDVASKYFLDVLFERRNHLFNTWIKREHSKPYIVNLLSISDIASAKLGKFVDDKLYLSFQRQQTNNFYRFLTQ